LASLVLSTFPSPTSPFTSVRAAFAPGLSAVSAACTVLEVTVASLPAAPVLPVSPLSPFAPFKESSHAACVPTNPAATAT
jgi:hypothetical protein